MKSLVVIGDMVGSRRIRSRGSLQDDFNRLLEKTNQNHPALVSPYTITLGDEFQAVLANGTSAFVDAIALQAALFPVQFRFSFAVGEISTRINPTMAIGMDGPAFHLARDGVESMKKSRTMYRIAGLPEGIEQLVNSSLAVAGLTVARWKQSRLQIMHATGQGQSVRDIARTIGLTDKAVYKSITEGGVEEMRSLFENISQQINNVLEG